MKSKPDGGQAVALQADVRDNDAVKTMVARTVKELGPIDILILNAGAKVPMKPFIELTFDEFEQKVMGELKGFFFPAQAVIPGMIERKKGCIIGISSGLSRYPGVGFSAHTTVKVGGGWPDEIAGAGAGAARYSSQHYRAGADCHRRNLVFAKRAVRRRRQRHPAHGESASPRISPGRCCC